MSLKTNSNHTLVARQQQCRLDHWALKWRASWQTDRQTVGETARGRLVREACGGVRRRRKVKREKGGENFRSTKVMQMGQISNSYFSCNSSTKKVYFKQVNHALCWTENENPDKLYFCNTHIILNYVNLTLWNAATRPLTIELQFAFNYLKSIYTQLITLNMQPELQCKRLDQSKTASGSNSSWMIPLLMRPWRGTQQAQEKGHWILKEITKKWSDWSKPLLQTISRWSHPMHIQPPENTQERGTTKAYHQQHQLGYIQHHQRSSLHSSYTGRKHTTLHPELHRVC